VANGFSVHVGLNVVDANHFGGFEGGWQGGLRGCERDAADLEALLAEEGFTTTLLLGDAAASDAVSAAVVDAAESCSAGDIFVLTFSGYGGDVPDRNSPDRWSEHTWAAYDRQLPDDELAAMLRSFSSEVRIVVIDDSSSSGTVRRSMLSYLEPPFGAETHTRDLPPDVVRETYRNNRVLYDDLQRTHPSADGTAIDAAVITLAGFLDGQQAADGPKRGVFTETLLSIWDGGGFDGSYERFAKALVAAMPTTQVPRLTERGDGASFIRERPFTI
jgi:hypothetical protein